MKLISGVFICIGIWLMMENGGLRSCAGLRCLSCGKNSSLDCKNSKAAIAAKDSISIDCFDEFNRLNQSTVEEFNDLDSTVEGSKENPGMTFQSEWKRQVNWNDSFVCVMQEIYATSKYPPGAEDETGKVKWDDGGSLELNKPMDVNRFCAIIKPDQQKHHKEVLEEVGGKFAFRTFLCKSKDNCNGSYKKNQHLEIVMLMSIFAIIQIIP